MGFDKPQPFIYSARNLGEQVCRGGVIQLVRFIDRVAGLASESGKCPGDGFDVGESVGNHKRIFVEPRTCCGHTHRAFGDAAQLHNPFGDQIHVGLHGFIHLVDRKSNMIISGGENIYPSEVEALLAGHPAVQDVAVIGVPDAKWGESVQAVIVKRPGHDEVDAAALEAWCRGRIAGYKRPKSFVFIDEREMPRTATGKIQHRRLRTQLVGG